MCVEKQHTSPSGTEKNMVLITEFSVQLLESNKLLMFNYTACINASVVHWYLDEERDKQHAARAKTTPGSILFLQETGQKNIQYS